jgi:hypothetical protein
MNGLTVDLRAEGEGSGEPKILTYKFSVTNKSVIGADLPQSVQGWEDLMHFFTTNSDPKSKPGDKVKDKDPPSCSPAPHFNTITQKYEFLPNTNYTVTVREVEE